MGKKCDREINKINEYLDKQSDLSKKGLTYIDVELERHLTHCSDCRQKVEEQHELFDNLAGLMSIEPPEDFTAQLIEKLPRNAERSLPNWSLALGTIMFSASTVVLFAVLYWLFKSGQTIGYFKNIGEAAFVNIWQFIKYIGTFLLDTSEFALGLLKAVWAIIRAYPMSFLTMTLVGVLLFIILIKMINNFQSENYA